KRASEGYVIPESKKDDSDRPSQTIVNAQKEFEGNIFADIASMLGGQSTKEIASKIEGELESKKRYLELNQEIKIKEKEVSKMFKELPTDKELKDLEKRAKSIDLSDLTNFSRAA